MNDTIVKKHHFSLGHKIKDIDKIEYAINTIRPDWDINEKSLFQLNLVLEELISNTMFYGFTGRDEGEIDVEIKFDGSQLDVEIQDNAAAYDPTLPVDDVSAMELEERQIGGLGIMLSQRISHEMSYKYDDNKNKLKFKISANSE